jgi:aminopeptidase N
MAHQWFGDLVTMKWWNGLWLNESFASYMGQLGVARSDEFKNPWLSFYRSKQGAYRTDDSITTHPIEVPVATTQNAFDNIDAITYNKGASVLHQLRKRIGDEAFQRGVHDYLVKYGYQNATLDDFIGSLARASGQDLSGFSKEWLYEPGLNSISADFACEGGKVSRFALLQAPTIAAYPTLRTQLVQVALFKANGDTLALAGKQAVTYSGARTEVPAFVGQACPDLVYPNYEDWGFAKVVLDPASFATARTHLANVEDPMLRSMLWQSLSDGLTDRRLGLDDFIQTVLANAPKEQDPSLLRQALGYVGLGRGYAHQFAAGSDYDRRVAEQTEKVLWDGLQASRGQRDRASNWLDTYITAATTPAALARLEGMLAGKVDPAGVEVDQEIRWDIIRQLNRYDRPGSAALIDAELARDKSESGQLSALGARVIRPDAEAKAKYLATVQALDGSEPYSRLRVIMFNLYPSGQTALSEASAAQRLETLAAIDAKADPVFMRTYAGSMIPSSCTAASVARLEQAMAAKDPLGAGTRRALVGEHESDARCLAIRRAFDASGVAKKK